jgi:hypothetical protein
MNIKNHKIAREILFIESKIKRKRKKSRRIPLQANVIETEKAFALEKIG